MQSIKILKLEGQKLSISSNNSHGMDLIKDHDVYLQNMSQTYFGKKLKFIISEVEKPNSLIENNVNDKDPYVRAIIDDLGGQEMNT